ncbi:NACHT, LRR and PYD domains-containing protein 4-like [Actinia tenebrosa]|uniref:NACHT, LRR and PYD domains-containing protein 4-like n=1 Tax=Actinia tenebrosa TaxID=6105 RepID=A0A6P8GZQ7_ACTTE|nr:NACHT, LRR and PYD domains-containing protein 4-like [Actinia tenebrosa]
MFLCPENDDQKSTASCTNNPKSIILTGKAGIGKYLFCHKMVRDWSHNRLFEEGQENAKVPDFRFVFLLKFRQLVLPEEKSLNLHDILNRSSLLNEHSVIDEPLLQYMIENPEKLLIILDGYNEYNTHREKITGDFETRYPNDPHEKIPVPALIAKIMKGKMLNGAVILISSRPGEAEELNEIVFDVRCDIQVLFLLLLVVCELDDECVKIICDMLPRTNITLLELDGNYITDVGVKIICDMLPRTKITDLCLAANNITDVGDRIICDMLPRTKITTLALGGNYITDVGAQCLCSVLIRDDCRLEVLDLQSNDITSECKLSLRQQQIPGVKLLI